MKWMVVLVACFAAAFINADSQCDLGPIFHYNPEMIAGVWHCLYASVDFFQEFVNETEVVTYLGDTYHECITVTKVNTGEIVSYNSTWQIIQSNHTLYIQVDGLPSFDGEYRISSIDYNYIIVRGCPASFGGEAITFIMVKDTCPSKCIIRAIREALEGLESNLDDFYKDPTVVCPSEE